ncbi:hypothetical protein BIW53_02250 [Pseudoalteromonas byunsanensis]|uniref:Endonuclease/exonuclease/phosphatase domain-containing protein n=2 Tax=Pseudoalteromonas byunsanensis TaxID=327939 RepID=A0A1S1N794_9GAMM|nr:hypothetical protein BIW53_02250 [Pseudoalteromonas byunsanensis]
MLVEYIVYLFDAHVLDFLCLCEVDDDDFNELHNRLAEFKFGLCDLYPKTSTSRSRFDCIAIYNQERFEVTPQRVLEERVANTNIKVAQLICVNDLDNDSEFFIYLAHWPSRLYESKDLRRKAASFLWNDAKELINESNNVIFMGDFNANPFEDCLTDDLNATRCHEMCRYYPTQFIYNPFWRSLTSEEQLSLDNATQQFPSGTYYYKKDRKSKWNAFDQILVSSSLVSDGPWYLNEYETGVIYDENIYEAFSSKDSHIDHFPIICTIDKV